MSDKFTIPALPGATGEREAETEETECEEGVESNDRTDHLGDDEAADAEDRSDLRDRSDHDHPDHLEEDDDDEGEEPSHPDAPAPPDMEEIAEIVAAAVETATAPLLEQIESQQQAINEITTAFDAFDPEQIAEVVATSVDSATTRLDGLCDKIISTLRHAHIESNTINNQSLIVKRQRSMMNVFLGRSYGDDRTAAIKEFCSPGEIIDESGLNVRILENPKPWALR